MCDMHIEVVNYSSDWKQQFKQEKKHIMFVVEQWVVSLDHVGSTSVPGLAAKPTIDMCMGVEDLQVANDYIIPKLENLGYEYLHELENEIPDRRYMQKLDESGKHLFHLHIVHKDSQRKKDYLSFRDYLIQNPEAVKQYADLKFRLSQKYRLDRLSYTNAKAEFIQSLLKKANGE